MRISFLKFSALLLTMNFGWSVLGVSQVAPKAADPAQPSVGEEQEKTKLVPVGSSYVKGVDAALVTVVEFTDFQCPFCSRGYRSLMDAVQQYPQDVRVVFKHFPLSFHKQAVPAHKAALAAGEQGKFWEMHDRLFESQKKFSSEPSGMRDFVLSLAAELKLDAKRFEKDLDNPKWDRVIEEDLALGTKLGVRGTPHFFINGERVKGAQPTAKFSEIIERQLAAAKEVLASGVKRDRVYGVLVAKNYEKPQPRGAKKPPKRKVEMVPVGPDDPIKGAEKTYVVTVVEFSDFQCPYCSRVNSTLGELLRAYPTQIRLVFKQHPLGFHKEAEAAHRAALAAHAQGKFWEMHDMLFENQKSFGGADMNALTMEYASKLGLQKKAFQKVYSSPKTAARIKDDMDLASVIGARGTPTFYINGIPLVGAQPFARFEEIIKGQIERAKGLQDKDKGLVGEALYLALVNLNKKDKPPAAPKAKPKPALDPNAVYSVPVGASSQRGPEDAWVTLVVFSEFQCPFCGRVAPTIDKILATYGKKVRFVFKHNPLSFHKQALSAANAVECAGAQGQFWPMHDILFANQRALTDADLETYARGLELSLRKWKACYEEKRFEKQILADQALTNRLGARGTPSFFINGRSLVGAQPFERFTDRIDSELEKAQKSGIPKSRYYREAVVEKGLTSAE